MNRFFALLLTAIISLSQCLPVEAGLYGLIYTTKKIVVSQQGKEYEVSVTFRGG